MNLVNLFLINSLLIFTTFIQCNSTELRFCTAEIEEKLIEINYDISEESFTIEKKEDTWIVTEPLPESRRSYTIQINSENNTFLVNHIPYSSISEGIKTEYNKVIKETKKLNVADLPNLGFQFLMYDKDIKKDKLAKVICSILCAIEELQ